MTPEQIVKKAEDIYQRQNIDKMMALFDPSIIVYWNGKKICEGLDQLREWHENWGFRKNFQIKKTFRAATGNVISVEWQSVWEDESGNKNESFGGEFWTFAENGLMKEWHAYYARYIENS